MKFKALATALAASTIASSAFAADLPSRKAPVVAPPPVLLDWSGFYVGLNAGAAFGAHAFSTAGGPSWSNPVGVGNGAPATAAALGVVAASNASGSALGFIGGGQVGYNLQFASAFVAGVEADIQGLAGAAASANASTYSSFAPFGFPANSYFSSATFRQRLDYLGTIRGRIGYLVTPSLLGYATGGLAYGGGKAGSLFSIVQTFPGATPGVVPPIAGAGSGSVSLGWTIGAGAEWMFAHNWSAKIEYLYYNLGSASADASLMQVVNNNGVVVVPTNWGSALAHTTTRVDGHIIRAGLNYHFDWGAPGPVVAKY